MRGIFGLINMTRKFSQSNTVTQNKQTTTNYQKKITSTELDDILKGCYETQFYQKTFPVRDYPNRVNRDELDKVLKESEATRKKFSIY